MNTLRRLLLVAAVYLLASRAALAMDIRQFEMMAEEDQHAYIGDLVWGAATLLEEDCKPQVAERVRRIFIHPQGSPSNDPLEGTQNLGERLLVAGKRAAERPEQAANVRVDDALRAILRDQGITLPDRFAAIDRAFKPKGPPPAQKPDDDASFGSATRVDDDIEGPLRGFYAVKILQSALDQRNLTEIGAGKNVQGVCRVPKQNEALTLVKQGFTLQQGGKQAEAAVAFREACDKGASLGCSVLGDLYGKGTAVPKDEARAAALYQRACEADEGFGCYNAGWHSENGAGVTRDFVRAAALYQKACDLNVAKGCFNLGLMYHEGKEITQDLSRAVALYGRACRGDEFAGCSNLGVMYNDGTGVEEDVDLALGFYKKACTGNNFGGCFNVGVLYEGGQGIDANAELAREFYRKACDGGYTRGCSKLEAKAAVPAPKPAAGGPPSVADYQPSWIGRTMVVRGTVSRFVQKNVNGEPYLYLYFKERPDSTVVACTRDDRWLLNVLGVDDFQSIVGKTLEFNLQVVDHPCTEQGASLWIWERHQARVVGGSAR